MEIGNKIHIYRFISHLLHPNFVLDISNFRVNQYFWNRFVQIGSSQLILPSIYCALKRKKLEKKVPVDLLLYLSKITKLNHQRNIDIIKQIDFLSKTFKVHQIEHVFLKGAAMLISQPQRFIIEERMIGDIDILVAEKDIQKAQNILLNKGFEALPKKFSFTKGVFPNNKKKDIDRIVHSNYIAAVEIHIELLHINSDLIKAKEVLKNKVQSISGKWIPSKNHLWQHAILNWQYNDNGISMNSLAFRTVADVLYLEPNDVVDELITSNHAIKSFYSLLSLFYGNYKVYYPLKKIIYKLQLQSNTFYSFYSIYLKTMSFIFIVFNRLFLFFISKTYQKRVLNNPTLFMTRVFKFWKNSSKNQ